MLSRIVIFNTMYILPGSLVSCTIVNLVLIMLLYQLVEFNGSILDFAAMVLDLLLNALLMRIGLVLLHGRKALGTQRSDAHHFLCVIVHFLEQLAITCHVVQHLLLLLLLLRL